MKPLSTTATAAAWLLAALGAACASAPPAPAAGTAAEAVEPASPLPAEVPAEAVPPAEAQAAAAAADATYAPSPPSEAEGSRAGNEVIVIDPGGGGAQPSPGELALATQGRRPAAGAAPRITNDNLDDYARQGSVTFAGVTPAAAAQGEAAQGGAAAGPLEAERDEAYWRDRLRGLRQEWRDTADEIERLEEQAADLRWSFYAEDDPWVRDGRIKPEWDGVVDRLDRARREVVTYPERVAAAVEEGRRAGALPGWLREGIDLEPAAEEEPATSGPAEPVEPAVIEPRGPDGEAGR